MRIRTDGRLWDVFLADDGTLDTVITVQPVAPRRKPRGQKPEYWPEQTERFSQEFAADYRRSDGSMTKNGLRALGLEAIEAYEFPEDEVSQ